MKRLDYLTSLEQYLKNRIPNEEIYEIMRDYAEYFEEGKRQGKTEDEISFGLGSPYDTAQQILEEQENPSKPKKIRRKIDFSKATKKLKDLNIGGFIMLILLIFLMIIILPPTFLFVVSMIAAFILLAFCGVIGIVISVLLFAYGTMAIGLCALFGSIFSTSLGIVGTMCCYWLIRKIYRYLVARFHRYTKPYVKQTDMQKGE